MGTLSKEGIQLVCDSVLVRNALVLRHAIEAVEEKGFVSEDHGLIEELRRNLQVMKEEIERRDLKMPEGEGQSGFLQGVEYTSESRGRSSSGSVGSRTSRISARVAK